MFVIEPGSQVEHNATFEEKEYKPAVQLVHVDAPAPVPVFVMDPAAHPVHTPAPALEYSPAAQRVHEVAPALVPVFVE